MRSLHIYQLSSTLLFIAFCFVLSAQPTRGQRPELPPGKGGIGGRVIDRQTEEPVSFANILVYRSGDTLLLTGGTTDAIGFFFIQPLDYGDYDIIINYLGYEDQKIRGLSLSEEQRFARAGRISLEQGSSTLAEIEVTAEAEYMTFDLEKKVFNVDKNLGATGGDAVEALRNIPSITVDVDGNISLRGSQNVRIFINGKPSGLGGFDRTAMLQQIPANMIKSVEVMTNPSARYNPEGMAGIINIVTKQMNRQGFNLNLAANAGSRDKYDGNIGLNLRTGKWNFTAAYSGRYSPTFRLTESDRNNFFADTSFTILQNTDGLRTRTSHNFTVGFDYFISPRNTLTASFRYGIQKNDDVDSVFFDYLDENAQGQQSSLRSANELEDEDGMEYELFYRKTFREEKREWTASARYSQNTEIGTSDLSEELFDLQNQSLGIDRQQTLADEKNTLALFQTDYIHPLENKMRLESGLETRFQRIDNNFILEDYVSGVQDFVENINASNHFIYDETLLSGYGIISGSLKKWNYQAGIRAEQALTNFDLLTTKEDFVNNYFNLFPSGSLSYQLKENQNLQFSYSRRINRPRTRSLNPFPDYTDTLNLRIGNPRLLPEFIHSMELNYQVSGDKGTFAPSVYYRNINDIIQRFTYVNENGVRISTWENLAGGNTIGLELVATYRPFSWWNLNGSFNFYFREINGSNIEADLNNDGYMASARFMSIWTPWKSGNIQLSGFWRSRGVTAQGTYNPIYSFDLGFRQTILNKRASIVFRIRDIFDTREFGYQAEGPNFDLDALYKRESQILFLGFTYTLRPDNDRRRDRKNGGDRGDMDDMEF
jgi:iron complex outermembrane receptor protein